ncbi:hypothetical protein [Microbacterium indicum]|uniref:hypothetical protein n=1 Tax=Microbacterium indicum TaxID=358100 RepID=UPI000413E97E|nr:hypothetical protein [Microbacterium indicum]
MQRTADPLGPYLRAVLAENKALRSRIAHMMRERMPKHLREQHVDQLLDYAAAHARGDTADELLEDIWAKFLILLDQPPQTPARRAA